MEEGCELTMSLSYLDSAKQVRLQPRRSCDKDATRRQYSIDIQGKSREDRNTMVYISNLKQG